MPRESSGSAVGRCEEQIERLHRDMAAAQLAPTWKYVKDFVAVAPRVTYRPYLWKWDDVISHLMRAGTLISPERGAERRSMEHVNPDLAPSFAASHTIATAFQLVRPGEVAAAHRHAAAAIRFPVRNPGGPVYTTVQGQRLPMEQFDLILTPAGTWHEHANETKHDVIWLDVLDYPLVNLLQASFFQPYPRDRQPVTEPVPADGRTGRVRPAGWDANSMDMPVLRYTWRDMRARLEAWRDQPGSPFDGVMLEYVHPLTAGPTLPTLACRVQLLRPGEHTRAHRACSSTVYFVIEGTGASIIAGERFEWGQGDVFVVPTWAWHEHASSGGTDALLFSVTDEPVMRVLGLFREEPFDAGDGQQRVTSVFAPEARPLVHDGGPAPRGL